MNINKVICPNCRKPFPFFVKPSRWVFNNWHKSPGARCPNCEKVFPLKISMKMAFIVLPLILLASIMSFELIEKVFELKGILGGIVSGALIGLLAGFGVRFCYTNDHKKDNNTA